MANTKITHIQLTDRSVGKLTVDDYNQSLNRVEIAANYLMEPSANLQTQFIYNSPVPTPHFIGIQLARFNIEYENTVNYQPTPFTIDFILNIPGAFGTIRLERDAIYISGKELFDAFNGGAYQIIYRPYPDILRPPFYIEIVLITNSTVIINNFKMLGIYGSKTTLFSINDINVIASEYIYDPYIEFQYTIKPKVYKLLTTEDQIVGPIKLDNITIDLNANSELETIAVKTTAGVVGGDNIADLTSDQTFTGNKTIQLNTSASTFTIADDTATLFLARKGQIDIYKNLYLSGKATITTVPTEDEDIVNKRYVDGHGGTPPDTTTIRITDNKLEAFALKRTSDILDANNIADLTSNQTFSGRKIFDVIELNHIVAYNDFQIEGVKKILIRGNSLVLESSLAPQIQSPIEPSLDNDIATVKYVNSQAGNKAPDGITCHNNSIDKLEVIAVKTTAGVVGGDNIADLTSQQTFTGNKDFTGGNNRFILTDANKFLRIGNGVQGEEITFNDHQVNFPLKWTVKFQGIAEALDPTTPQQIANRNYVDSNFPKKTDFDNLTIVTSSSFGNKWTAMANVKVFGNDDPNTVPRGYCITGSTNIPFGWSTVGSSVLGFGHVKHSGGSIQIALGFSNVNNGLMATRSTVNTSNFTAWDTISTPFRHRERFVLATGQILATVSTAFSIASTIKQARYATALLSNQYVIPPVAVAGDFLCIKFDLQMTINSGANPNIEFVLWNATTGAQLGNTRIFQYSNQAGNTTFDFATIPFVINTTTLKVGDHLEVRYRLTNTSTAYSILPNSYIFWEIERVI